LFEWAIVLYGATVTISEDELPTASPPTTNGEWQGPASVVSYLGEDSFGLRRVAVYSDGQEVVSRPGVCVDWSLLACAEPSAGGSSDLSGTSTFGALGLSQGTHTLTTVATDAAQNVSTSAPITVNVDTSAPVARSLSGSGLSSAANRTFSWLPAEGGSPITDARVRLCVGPNEASLSCTWKPTTADGPLTFPLDDGAVATAAVEMTDAAGNVGTSGTVRFLRDATAPAAATLTAAPSSDAGRTVDVSGSDDDVVAYQLRLCSPSGCSDLPRQGAGRNGTVRLWLPGPGSYTLEVSLVDAAGNIGEPSRVALVYSLPGTTPVTPKPVVLEYALPKRLGKTSLLVKGTVGRGSVTKVTIALAGKRPGGKHFTITKSVKPSSRGTYSIRFKLPKRFNRAKGVDVAITAKPADGWLKAVAHKHVRG
jgi:hypothetical protein